MEKNIQLVELSQSKILDILDRIPDLSNEDKKEIALRLVSDDLELRKVAMEKIEKSQIARQELFMALNQISTLNLKDRVFSSKQTLETGSGSIEVKIQGGDSRLTTAIILALFVLVLILIILIFK